MLNEDIEYGVTSTGFVRKRLPEIREDIFTSIEDELGITVSHEPNSMIGVLVGIFASEIDRQWQLAEQDYYDRSPMSAGEGSIDNTLAYTLVSRKLAESSYLYAVCYGNDGTTIYNNAQISDGTYTWTIAKESEITVNNCVSLTCTLDNVVSTARYGFKIGNAEYYTGGTNANAICKTLKERIEALEDWAVTVENNQIVLEQNKETNNRKYGEQIVPYGLTIVKVGTPIIFRCDTTGVIEPTIDTITEMKTIYTGWTAVSNESDAYVGRDAETVTELRQRYANAVYGKSVSMKESLKAAILEIEDVKTVIVYENKTDVDYTSSGGLPPHSFRVIVDGGDDLTIAQAILNKAPLGIESITLNKTKGGNYYEDSIQDSSGLYDTVCFDRPVEVPIYMKVTIEQYSEETLPGDIVETIKTLLYKQGKSFTIGKDVIPQRFFGTLYSNIDGIGNIKIEISTDGETYTTSRLPIAEDSYATLSTSNIYVTVNPLGE